LNLTDLVFIGTTLLMWYLTYFLFNIKYEELNIEKIVHDIVMAGSMIMSSILSGISVNIMIRDNEEI
jgi:hypothetical protein